MIGCSIVAIVGFDVGEVQGFMGRCVAEIEAVVLFVCLDWMSGD